MDSERFKPFVAVLIAVLTACAAIIAQLETEAGNRDDRAGRDTRTYSMEAFGSRVRGDSRANFDYYGAYGQYKELEILRELAEERDDAKSAARYEVMRDKLMDTTPLLSGKDAQGKRYFDPKTDAEPDINRYEAEIFVVPVERKAQQFKAASAVKEAWDTKANTYVVHLTLLAVSLFLLGLAATIATDATQKIFVVLGASIALVAVLWAFKTWAEPVTDLRARGDAIEQYAVASGLMYQGLAKEALPHLDKAIAAAPEYADAYLERGRAYLELEPSDFQHALDDLKKASELNPANESIALELSWCQYNLGDFAASIASARGGLQNRPDDLTLQMMLGLSTLASGDVEGATKIYQDVMDAASRSVAAAIEKKEEPAADIFTDLESGSDDLASLLSTLEEKKGPPPPDKIQKADAVKKAADQLGDKLSNLALALEATGKPPQGQLTAKIENLEFADAGVEPAEAAEDDTFKDRPYQVSMSFDYSGMKDGQTVTYRYFLDGDELDAWRYDEKWTGGPSGSWEIDLYPGYSEAFRLDEGEYNVQIYVDYNLAAYSSFTVKEEE